MAEDTQNAPSGSGPADGGPAQSGGAAGPAGGGQEQPAVVVDMPSYEGDVAAMRAHIDFVDSQIDPHFEGLITSAEQAGMGAQLVQALGQAQEKVRGARASMSEAVRATVDLNQAVAQAHADAAEAATNKTYYQSE